LSKPATRLQLFTAEITGHYPEITPEQVAAAFAYANQRFNHYWKNEYVTPSVAARLQEGYAYLNLTFTPGFDKLVQEIEEMELNIPPDFAPGVHAALAALAQDYKLGIISDTIHTTGRGLRQLLESQKLLHHFSCFVFSDEFGASKPAPTVFEQAAAGLGAPLAGIVHVGDRESNDIEGPLGVGMKAILYTGVIDRGSAQTRAHAICRDYADLPRLIKELDH
jgi:putative hydrolase of the HAD superfamily